MSNGDRYIPKYPLVVELDGTHPVVYSANGSHGLWASPGFIEIKLQLISFYKIFGVLVIRKFKAAL